MISTSIWYCASSSESMSFGSPVMMVMSMATFFRMNVCLSLCLTLEYLRKGSNFSCDRRESYAKGAHSASHMLDGVSVETENRTSKELPVIGKFCLNRFLLKI